MSAPAERSVDCVAARALMHERLDGPMDAARAADLGRHLIRCPDCRGRFDDFVGVERALRAIPLLTAPQQVVEDIVRATVAARAGRGARRRRFAAGLAAALALVAVGFGWLRSREAAPSAAEVRRADADIRLTFGIVSAALRRGDAAVSRVLVDEVAPALAGAPILGAFTDAPHRR